MTDHIAHAEIVVDAPPDAVWKALTDPASIKQYMFGADVQTTWQVGAPITWTGEMGETPYRAKGTVEEFQAAQRLVVTHFSPAPGKEDVPENYQRIQYDLDGDGDSTTVELHQTGNDSEQAALESSGNWQQILEGVKKVAEGERR